MTGSEKPAGGKRTDADSLASTFQFMKETGQLPEDFALPEHLGGPGPSASNPGGWARRRSVEELRAMGFIELRNFLLEHFIPCSGITTMEGLLALHEKKWGNSDDRDRLPLYVERSKIGS
jgi:hypothetical protein